MSTRERAVMLMDYLPDALIDRVVSYLEELVAELPLRPEIPNAETLAAFEEIESGGGHRFYGTVEELFQELERELEEDA